MKIFLSWSGDVYYAKIFKQELQKVFPTLDIFVSADIKSGNVSPTDIMDSLKNADYGVVFLTENNHDKPWIIFETGALMSSTYNNGGRLLPIALGDFQLAELVEPLRSLQVCRFNDDVKSDVFDDLFDTIEKKSGLKPESDHSLQSFFRNVKGIFNNPKVNNKKSI